MSASERDQDRERDAAAWIARLQSRSVSTHDLADFARWRSDPLNAEAYERAESFWESCADLKDDADVSALVGSTLNSRATPERRVPLISALVASALLLLAATVFTFNRADPRGEPDTYATVTGERSILSLEDGTKIVLDTDSQITSAIDSRERTVALTRGRVSFNVGHDARRPFVVTVDDRLSVRAYGTKFDVFRHNGEVDVTLYQGSVEVTDRKRGRSVRLSPGQTTKLGIAGLAKPRVVRADENALWQMGRLSFHETPLSDAIGQINRYTDRPLRLSNEDLSADRISGEFSSDDIDGFAAAANALYGSGSVFRSKVAD